MGEAGAEQESLAAGPPPVDDVIIGSFGGETFIPYSALLANDGPGAVFGGISNGYVFGGTIVDDPGRGGIVIDFPGFSRDTAFFEYSLVGIAGTAFVEVDLSNSPPITTAIARVVTPGTDFFLSFDDIRDKLGNFDPDNTGLPPLVQVTGAASPDVTYSLSATGIDLTFAPGYSGGFSLDYTLTDQPLLATSLPSTISFILAAPPAPVTVNEVLNWGINSDGGTLFQGRSQGFGQIYARELLANDMAMPGSVLAANSPRDTTPLDENLAIRSIQFGVPGLDGVTSRSDTAFGFEFKDDFVGADTYEYIVVDPLGRSATGLITLNVSIPQPVLTDTVIIVPTGATSVTVAAADILDDDTFFGTGAIARINANVATAAEFSAVDSGVHIGAGSTRLDGFTLNFNPARTLDSYQFNVLTFDTAAAGGSASGWQRVTFQQANPSPPPVFRLSVIENVMVEGTAPDPGGYIAFAIERLAGGALGASTVSVAVAGSGAQPAAADDVIGGFATRQVSFAAGETYETFSLQMTPDALDEPDELLTLMLTGATFGTVDATPVTAIILDDDVTLPPPVFTLRLIENVETEGTPPGPGGYIAFRVERDAGSDLGAATVLAAVSTAGPNPIDGDDLTTGFNGVQIVFAEGQTHAQFSLQAIPDAAFEPDETLTVALVLTTLGTVDGTPVLATIINDDLPPPVFRLSVIENVMAEGTAPGPGGSIAFAVERLAGGALGASTVSVAVAGSGAQPAAADDVIGGFATRQVSFAAGETYATFSLQMTPDALDEPDELLTLMLTGATFGTVDATPVTAIIFNDDVFPEVALVAGSFSAFEGDTLGGLIQVTIRRTGDLSYATEATFAVAGLDTTTAADIAIIADGGTPIGAGFGSFTVTFAPGVADRVINIVAAADTVPEADERFTLTLTGASLGTLSATEPLSITGTIVNDDVFPEVAFAAADVGATPEGTPGVAGGGVLFFTLLRSGIPDVAFTVDLRLSGTAHGADLAGILGATQQADPALWRVAFAAGQDSATVEIRVQPDATLELDETVAFTIEGANGATLSATGPLTATGVIIDDDATNATAGADLLAGTPGPDLLRGLAGDDTLRGLAGDDTLDGGDGDDRLVGGPGADRLIGGAGFDTAVYGGTTGVVVNLALGTGSGGEAEGDTLTGIEAVTGTRGQDWLIGDGGANRLVGGDGDDTLDGGDGDDRLVGGQGADTLIGGAGRDTAVYGGTTGVVVNLALGTGSGGEAEGDALAGIEDVTGTSHDDVLIGDGGANRLVGGDGDDTLDGRGGDDQLVGGAGRDLFIYTAAENAGARDSYIGGAGIDTLRLVLTASEWARAAVKADVAAFRARFPDQDAEASNGFNFRAFSLKTKQIERLEVVVDGVLLVAEPPPAPQGLALAAESDTGLPGEQLIADFSTEPESAGYAQQQVPALFDLVW